MLVSASGSRAEPTAGSRRSPTWGSEPECGRSVGVAPLHPDCRPVIRPMRSLTPGSHTKQTPKLDDPMCILVSQRGSGSPGSHGCKLGISTGLPENASLPSRAPAQRCFSSGLFLPVAPRSPALFWLTLSARATQGQWAADGGSPGSCCLQILRDSRPGAG